MAAILKTIKNIDSTTSRLILTNSAMAMLTDPPNPIDY